MQIEQEKLKNNLNTLFIHSPGNRSASVQMWFRAGSALEEKKDEGVAHFLEHMFFKGTQSRPGAQIAHEVESYGGEINAFTSFDYTCYYINTPNSNLTQTVSILMDMVSNPMFREEDLIPERGVVFEEYRRSQDNPGQYGFQQIQKQSFTSGYAHPILGTPKTINHFTPEQVKSFRKNHYNLSNAMLVIAGDLNKKNEIIKEIEAFTMPDGPNTKFPKFNLKSKSTHHIYEKDVRMAQMTMLIQAPHYEKLEASSEDLALSALGYGESSRLYQKLVLDNGLANAVSASSMFFAKGGSHFIKFSCPTENLKKVYDKFLAVLKEVKKKGLSKEEISKIKNQYIASKVYEKESIESFAFSLGHGFAQNGDIKCEEEFINRLQNATDTEVNHSLVEIFNRTTHISLQLPKGEKSEKVKKELLSFQKNLNDLFKIGAKKASVRKEKIAGSKYDPQVKIKEIKKGIKLLYRHNPMTPTFVLHAYMKGGITEETKRNNGLYNLLASTITKGYKGVSNHDLKQELEFLSSNLNGFTGKNAYGITMHGLTQYMDKLKVHFFNTLLTPSFKMNDISHEKKMALRILENYKEDTIKQLFKRVNEIFHAGHPYSLSTIGDESAIKKLSRKLVNDTHEKNLKTKEILITYCGDLPFEVVEDFCKEHLKSLKPRTPKKLKAKSVKPAKIYKDFIKLDREQCQIFLGLPGYKLNHKNDLYLKMLSTHLSGQSSDLFVKVRDELGLCYAVQPIHFTALESGFWGIYIGAGRDKTKLAIDAIKEILKDLQVNGLSKQYVERIKATLKGQNQINVQVNEDYANIYSVPLLQGVGVDYHYETIDKINAITQTEFNQFLSSFLKKKMVEVIVGPNE